MQDLGERASEASKVLATASTDDKNETLRTAADCLVAATQEVLDANLRDVRRAEASQTSETVIDRLRLDAGRVEAMAEGLRKLIHLPDPAGKIVESWTRPNGLQIQKVQVPLGVVAIIYENRPNVTSDAFGL